MKTLTDRKLLERIHSEYYATFAEFREGDGSRQTKIYVPIDVDEIAEHFKVDGDIVFGRLHYHLDRKHGYRRDDGSYVHLFASVAGSEKHCINFPVLDAVLADLQSDAKRFGVAIIISVISLVIAGISLAVSVFG